MSHSTDLLDNEQTSALLCIRPNTLEVWRSKGKGPPFIKFGNRPQGTHGRHLWSEPTGAAQGREVA